MKKYVGLRVIVQVEGLEYALEGKLIDTKDDQLVLIDTRVLSEKGKTPPIDGRAIVPRRRVVWVQVP